MDQTLNFSCMTKLIQQLTPSVLDNPTVVYTDEYKALISNFIFQVFATEREWDGRPEMSARAGHFLPVTGPGNYDYDISVCILGIPGLKKKKKKNRN